MPTIYRSLVALKKLLCNGSSHFDSELLFEIAKMFLNGFDGPKNINLGKALILIAADFESFAASKFIEGNEYLFNSLEEKRIAKEFTKSIMESKLDCNLLFMRYNEIIPSDALPAIGMNALEIC